jgi:DNA-binding transcriptional ArsR family regulator
VSYRLFRIFFYALLAFSIINTIGALWLFSLGGNSVLTTAVTSINGTSAGPQASFFQAVAWQTPNLAAAGWGLVFITSLWYQRTISVWKKMGFSSDVFRLLMRTRGGPTRIRVLRSLIEPKNRLELARELGYDWNVIDRHIKILLEYGIIGESLAYGNVRLYKLTKTGKTLLRLIEELQAA